jgi:hypothetical protein
MCSKLTSAREYEKCSIVVRFKAINLYKIEVAVISLVINYR